jgi:K+-sensing histidine kinase KdpD
VSELPTAAPAPLPRVARYGASLLFVAVATAVAVIVEHSVAAPNLTLIFVLPVIAAATSFGWGPSLLATAASVLAFDFFFTEPRYSLAITSPSDIWAAALLLVIAVIVSAVAAQSRRRERAARQAAEQAGALQTLANVVIHSASRPEIAAAAATALSRIFGAPSVIFLQGADGLSPVASAGDAKITPAETAAAQGALDLRAHTHAEAYPYPNATFDFWPVATRQHHGCVIGVAFIPLARPRPAAPDRFIEIVSAYLAVALEREGGGATSPDTSPRAM